MSNKMETKKYLNSINSPKELLLYMASNIKYGYLGKNKRVYHFNDQDFNSDWYEQYVLQNSTELTKNLYGNCWDQVELERAWFLEKGYEIKTIFEFVNLDYENNYPTHSFLVYKDNNSWNWFENADFVNQGIHSFTSYEEVINYQYQKYLEFLETFNIKAGEKQKIMMLEFTKPQAHVTAQEYLDFVIRGKKLAINSKNRLLISEERKSM